MFDFCIIFTVACFWRHRKWLYVTRRDLFCYLPVECS